MQSIEVYLEIGKKRTFAGALSWPGWCRSGKDEAAALQALCDVGQRYASVLSTNHMLRTDVVAHTGVGPDTAYPPHPSANLHPTPIEFQAPADPSAFVVVERLRGDTNTDFGAPGQVPAWDQAEMHEAELLCSQDLLRACWLTFDVAAAAALGKQLRTGPRGGGRDLDRLTRHVEEDRKSVV